jgi:hypothetical protein
VVCELCHQDVQTSSKDASNSARKPRIPALPDPYPDPTWGGLETAQNGLKTVIWESEKRPFLRVQPQHVISRSKNGRPATTQGTISHNVVALSFFTKNGQKRGFRDATVQRFWRFRGFLRIPRKPRFWGVLGGFGGPEAVFQDP